MNLWATNYGMGRSYMFLYIFIGSLRGISQSRRMELDSEYSCRSVGPRVERSIEKRKIKIDPK